MKAAIEREATEVFRVATECGYGLTKGSESPLTTGAAMLASTIPNRVSSESHECSHSNGRSDRAASRERSLLQLSRVAKELDKVNRVRGR